jgi:uncharacterized protein YggE
MIVVDLSSQMPRRHYAENLKPLRWMSMQASKQASKQASREAVKQARKHAKEETNKLAISCNKVFRLHFQDIHSFSHSATEPFSLSRQSVIAAKLTSKMVD